MADEPRPLHIDGRDYPVPALETFDMDEWQILHEKTGLTLDTIEDASLSPGLLRTLLIVAYRRGNPDAKMPHIEKRVGAINFLEVMTAIAGVEDGDADDPPAVTESSPLPSETSKDVINGAGSASGSGPQAVVPLRTGTPPSDTPQTYSPAVSAS